MPAEVPYAEILDSATATSPEALSSLSADISLPQSTASSSASGNEKPRSFSPASVPHNLRPTTLNATKDMYWFAHMGEASQGNGSEGEGSPVHNEPQAEGAAKNSPVGKGATSPGHSESKEEALSNAQRDPELRLRHYKELQEEERIRKLTELQYASQQAQRFREQQEEDRRRKIDELRSKDVERRMAVEERKRLIWEAEQERKEAILRRNLEREAKIEARRNAQRNTMSIAFGSSTPRDIDLPTGTGMAGSRGSTYGSMMVLSSPNQPQELFKKRTPSADVLDKDSDPMTRSLVILSGSRGRRKTDLTPTIPWERESALRSASPGTIAGNRTQAKRAVSMSRLDILAQPRRRPSANMDPSVQGVASPAAVNSTKGFHKDLHSPSRPRSSQSMASEQSVASTVSMRSQSGPRRARPFSIAGSIIPANLEAGQVHLPLPPQRRSRTAERKAPVVPPTRPPRAKSVGSDVLVPVSKVSTATPASKKPPLAPKPGQNATKAEKEVESEPADKDATEKADDRDKPTNEVEQALPSVEKTEQIEQETVEASPQVEPQAATQPAPAKVEEGSATPLKGPRITSEEEAKAALAEKRRLAREQAEREAEAERLRQEELRRQEEERIRLEEEEQRRMEEEQLRLAAELRQQEEEKLQRAIEEQRKKEEEDKARKEEENKMRLEKEEQERKLKEEAEKQRQELEEKLRQEEAARAERKKRVEQIMKRTRTKNEGSAKGDDSEKPADGAEAPSAPAPAAQESTIASEVVQEVMSEPAKEEENVLPVTESVVAEDSVKVNGLNNVSDSETKETGSTETPAVQNGFEGEFTNTTNGVVGKAKSGLNSEDVSPQTNGYSSHDVSFSEISPEEKNQPDVCPLLDFTLQGASNEGHWNQEPPPPPTDFDQLIDLSLETTNQNELNRLNNADELNSNRVPSIPFIAFEDNVTRKQESSVTDLLS